MNQALRIFILVALGSSNCSTTSSERRGAVARFKGLSELKPLLLSRRPDIEIFDGKGPFSFSETRDFQIPVTRSEIVSVDIYLTKQQEKGPLVIIQHGNRAGKDVHRDQAKRLATWGMNALVLSQPNRHRWIENGHTLSKLVQLLHSWPALLDHKFDPQKIIVVGHSFGGSAAAIAAGSAAPLKGAVFLDPALVSRKVVPYLQRIDVPTVVLAADRRVFQSRKRRLFFRNIPKDTVQVSVKGATHNDAQSPALFSFRQFVGIDQPARPDKQAKFMAAIVAASFSLATTGSTRYAWQALRQGVESGDFIDPKRK